MTKIVDFPLRPSTVVHRCPLGHTFDHARFGCCPTCGAAIAVSIYQTKRPQNQRSATEVKIRCLAHWVVTCREGKSLWWFVRKVAAELPQREPCALMRSEVIAGWVHWLRAWAFARRLRREFGLR